MAGVDPNFTFSGGSLNIEVAPEQMAAMEFIVGSDAWVGVFRPLLMGMLRSFYHDLADPSQERRDLKSDDYCRGGIMVVNALLTFPESAITEKYREQERVEGEKSIEQDYADRASAGSIGPLGFPTNPEDDY
jgi:hypothetical protein